MGQKYHRRSISHRICCHLVALQNNRSYRFFCCAAVFGSPSYSFLLRPAPACACSGQPQLLVLTILVSAPLHSLFPLLRTLFTLEQKKTGILPQISPQPAPLHSVLPFIVVSTLDSSPPPPIPSLIYVVALNMLAALNPFSLHCSLFMLKEAAKKFNK
jgi:hypothetical protein